MKNMLMEYNLRVVATKTFKIYKYTLQAHSNHGVAVQGVQISTGKQVISLIHATPVS